VIPTAVRAPSEIGPANALIETARGVSTVLGPACAGILIAVAGPGAVLVLDGATFLIAGLFLLRLHIPSALFESGRRSFAVELVDGWRAVRAHDWMLSVMWYNAAFQLVGVSALSVLGPAVARSHLGGATSWAAIGVASGAGGLAASLFALRLRPRRPMFTAYAVLFGTVPVLLCLGLTAPLPITLVASAASGFALILAAILSLTTLQRLVPSELQSRVASYSGFGAASFYPLGLAAMGPLSAWLGASAVLVAAGVLVAVLTALALAVPGVRAISDAKGLPTRAPGPERATAPGG
jgi:hypothetical protein